ncbi:hypothetical protein SDC9_212251 [bioreactor metagenome]|uniref:Uncharacterized protein n=1 Tax=bioreactor metagenome TaxID=1076179 RepID=A0A645JM45_9ZZZZ
MVAVIEADADELAYPYKRNAEPGLGPHQRQRFEIELAQAALAFARIHRGIDVAHVFGKRTDAALRIEHAGLLPARRAVTDEFHGRGSVKVGGTAAP